MWVLKERRHQENRCRRKREEKERGGLGGIMSLYTPYAEGELTRLMGSERWQRDSPTNLVLMHEALKDALSQCCPHSSTWLSSHN